VSISECIAELPACAQIMVGTFCFSLIGSVLLPSRVTIGDSCGRSLVGIPHLLNLFSPPRWQARRGRNE
jgi:hypothetical protein